MDASQVTNWGFVMGRWNRGSRKRLGATALLMALCGVASALVSAPSSASGADAVSGSVAVLRPATVSGGKSVVPASAGAGVRVTPTPGRGAPPAVQSDGKFDAATSVEVVGERGARQSVFQNADGSRTMVASVALVNYQLNGRWEKIDSHLVADDSGSQFELRRHLWLCVLQSLPFTEARTSSGGDVRSLGD